MAFGGTRHGRLKLSMNEVATDAGVIGGSSLSCRFLC
jgi:hypothetical protein